MIVDNITTKLAAFGLDTLMAKQAVTAQNIANANVKSYKAMQIDFSSQVEALKNSNTKESILQTLDDINTNKPTAQQAPANIFGSHGVELDNEIAASTENTLKYQALVESLNKHFGLLQIAITGRS